MAKIKNVLMAGLLALVSVFSIGMFVACGNEADNGGKTQPEPEPVVVQTVKLGDVVVSDSEGNGTSVSFETFMNLDDSEKASYFLNRGTYYRDFTVVATINGNEVANIETKYADDVKTALYNTEVKVNSGDVIVVDIKCTKYVDKEGTWLGGAKGDVLGFWNKYNKSESQKFIVK